MDIAGQSPPDRRDIALCLSGGGFRAAYFHLGVLAHLADTDSLHRVRVISCVSGGAIVGAQLALATKGISWESIVGPRVRQQRELITTLIRTFHGGVQTNLRVRALTAANLIRVMQSRRFSLSESLGRLYVTAFGLGNHDAPDPPLRLSAFADTRGPHLIVNATCLNSGRPWRFEGHSMGEDEGAYFSVPVLFPTLDLLRTTGSPIYDNFPLFTALAASTCVPGVFEPVVLGDYPGDSVAEGDPVLVDGGVSDNLGLGAILGHKQYSDCAIVISDGSGWFSPEREFRDSYLTGVYRASSTQSETLRAQLLQIANSCSYRPFEYIGLSTLLKSADRSSGALGIPSDTRRIVAQLRTDLDAFCDLEADSVMLAGYQAACDSRIGQRESARRWEFHEVEATLGSKSSLRILEYGRHRLLRFSTPVRAVGFVMLACVIPALAAYLRMDLLMSMTLVFVFIGWTVMMMMHGLIVYVFDRSFWGQRRRSGIIIVRAAALSMFALVIRVISGTLGRYYLWRGSRRRYQGR